MVATPRASAEISHGRGGRGNIAPDDTPYVDGEVVRAGEVGSHNDGAFSTGRGGELLSLCFCICYFLSNSISASSNLGRSSTFSTTPEAIATAFVLSTWWLAQTSGNLQATFIARHNGAISAGLPTNAVNACQDELR